MAKGDHIYVSFLFDGVPVTHHGIDCGDGTVIEYQGYQQGGRIARISKVNFGIGRTIHVKKYGKCDTPAKVLERAENMVGKQEYCLFSNNCEHFAYWCKTGKKNSEQVKNAVDFTGAIPTGVLTKIAVKTATKAAIKATNPITKGLIKIGLKQAPKVAGRAAVGIAGAGGVVTGLAADAIVGKILEDDEHSSQHERNARKTGRIAGQVASTVGAVGGTVAAGMIGGTVAIAGAVAAPAVLGIGIGLGAYHLAKGNKSDEDNSDKVCKESLREIEID
jgi:hypothetical protein